MSKKVSPKKLGLVQDDCFLAHDTGYHPECPARVEAVNAALARSCMVEESVPIVPVEISDERLLRIHSERMVRRILDLSRNGGGRIDADTIVSSDSESAARKAAGAGLAAVDAVCDGTVSRVFCAVRPPGHHATPTYSMGFCLFNNVAIAVSAALDKEKIQRVAVVDFDVHHGNGTQDCFYDRGDVFFFSIHQWPHYPGTGLESEKGTGEGLGKTLNFPLPGGVSRETWFDKFREGLDRVSDFDPDLVLVSAGFDSHRKDPLGDFPLCEEDYRRIAELLCDLAGDRGLVSFLEGGYNLEALPRSVVAYLQGHH